MYTIWTSTCSCSGTRARAGACSRVCATASSMSAPTTTCRCRAAIRTAACATAALDPVAGLTYRIAPTLNGYASYGRGFETPTLNDLAYRSTNGSLPGLNFGLEPARSDNFELGIKAERGWLRADLDAFYVKTAHELAVLADANGKSVYQNIGETERRGIELASDATLGRAVSARGSPIRICMR
jgi:outer membrane receptor protein involved in Fe transport